MFRHVATDDQEKKDDGDDSVYSKRWLMNGNLNGDVAGRLLLRNWDLKRAECIIKAPSFV